MNENAKKWVEALRSGDYKQATGVLTRVNDKGEPESHCCLGVACQVAIENGVPLELTIREDTSSYEDSEYENMETPPKIIGYVEEAFGPGISQTSVLPPIVQKWLGLTTLEGTFDEPIVVDREDDYYTLPCEALTELNDKARYTFEQIADVIEAEPEGLFTDA